MVVGTAGAGKEIHPDSIQGEVTLRYDINPGDHYAYKLTTDQVVVNNHSTRLQTAFELRAIARDARGNTRCRIKLSSDPVRDSSAIHGTDLRKKRFAGYRSWVQEQAYEAVLDALGRILASTVVASFDTTAGVNEQGRAEPLSERITEYTNTPQEDPATPELMNFILPTTSITGTIGQGTVWSDTFTIGSKTQFTPSIRPGQTSAPVLIKDSLFRTTRVDSFAVLGGRQQCFLSLKTVRCNASGTKLVAFSTLQRDVPTGLVVALHEKAYRMDNDDATLHYTASAVLVPEKSTSLPPTEEGTPLSPR